jgi:biopolymer transport protein ExbD
VRGKTMPLNLIPLIDFFLLLALFALILTRWPEAIPDRALRVELPRAEGIARGAGPILLELDREGNLALNGRPLTLEELEGALRPLLQQEKIVRLEADRSVPHGNVVRVIGIVARAGGERVEVGVRP